MDIGSRGGGWSRKSPKLLLLEWTQSRKQPKPRFKALPTDDSKFRCKVRFNAIDISKLALSLHALAHLLHSFGKIKLDGPAVPRQI